MFPPMISLRSLLCLAPLSLFALAGCPSEAPLRKNLPAPEYEPPRGAQPIASQTASAAAIDEAAAPSADDQLLALEQAFLDGYFARQPVRATEAGEHRYDGKWPDPSVEGDKAYRELITKTQKSLAAIDEAKLSLEASIDKSILANQLELQLFSLDEQKPAETDPLFYTGMIGDGLDPLITREFGTAEGRGANLADRLEGIPAIVAAAKKRLASPSEVHTKTAIDQNKGLIDLCKKGLVDAVKQSGKSGARIEKAAKVAAVSLEDFQTFLEKDLLPRSKGDFRLGRARFEKKLGLLLDDTVNADAFANEARALMKQTREEMLVTAKELWPELMKGKAWKEPKDDAEKKAAIKAVLGKLAEERSTNATIVKDAEATLAAATAFVKEKNLVRLPEEECRIIEMPEYRRGVAIAYCDSSGPLEEKPQTFYAISPTPKDWPKKRVDSFYREYNKSMLFDLTVHEAMPGHFLQAMHNNRFPSKLRAVFSHGAFVEGWAVYTEWLMAKHGFGGAKVRMQRQKMALRMSANAVLDNGVHAGTLSEKDALAMMMDEAFQEEGEAVGKWRRARLTSGQLSTYFYGFSELFKLRKQAEGKPGFSERAYHDELLAHGSPAPRYMRRILAKDGAR